MYFPLHVHSHFSLLDGLNKPEDIMKRCKHLGLAGSALTDHGSLSGSVAFMKIMQKNGLKPITGCELYICPTPVTEKKGRELAHLVVLAKNMDGWKDLVGLSSESNRPENMYYKPRLDLPTLAKFCNGNIIGFSGHMGSHLANSFFENPKAAYSAHLQSAVANLVKSDYLEAGTRMAYKLQEIFGKGNFYLEVQRIDQKNAAAIVISDLVREIGEKTGIPCIATPDAHYATRADALHQRVLLCTKLNTTLRALEKKLVYGEDVGMSSFFTSDSYHIPSPEEMQAIHTPEELKNTLELAEKCEIYDVTNKPKPPKYVTPDGSTSETYLRKLCRDGWAKDLPAIREVQATKKLTDKDYGDRVNKELHTLLGAELADYFLIVHDIIQFALNDGQLIGPGRGSGAGSLVLGLLDVTQVDPMEYDLIFERFYNAGRNTDDHVSMPDVDMDFEIHGRARIIEYMRERFGRDRVAQMVTFTRMQGRSALKDVLRVHGACGYDEMNRITEFIPDEAEISDQLQVMREADKLAGGDGEASIIDWALDNHAKDLKSWCYKDENGRLQGPLARMFAQAIKLEGTKRSRSKHAGGVIISQQPLAEVCPMVFDKTTGEMICGLEMGNLEDIGLIKFDILGVACLDKLHVIQELVNAH